MDKVKPLSLYPLSLDEALQALIRADPARADVEPKRRKPAGKRIAKPRAKK